jgi:hypothetical protein
MSTHASPRPVSAPLSTTVWVAASSVASSAYANGLNYVPLRTGVDDYVQFQFVAAKTGLTKIGIVFAMSAPASADIALRVDKGEFAMGEDPSAALTVGDVFYYSTQNDMLLAEVTSETNASLAFQTVAGRLYVVRINRLGTDVNDTHSGDMRVVVRGY